jgi:hypothetical protein
MHPDYEPLSSERIALARHIGFVVPGGNLRLLS